MTSATSSSNLERQRETTNRIVNEIERADRRAQRPRRPDERRTGPRPGQPRREAGGARAPARRDLQARHAVHLPGPARRRVVRRPAVPLQVPLPHSPAGPALVDDVEKLGAAGGTAAAEDPARSAPSSTAAGRSARPSSSATARWWTSAAQPAPRGAPHRPDHRPAALRAGAGRGPAQRPARRRSKRARRDARAPRPRGAGMRRGTLTTADIGKLDWPVEGPIVYQLRPRARCLRRRDPLERDRHRAPCRHAGQGGGGGQVELVQNVGTYGLTVILEHGNGYRSLYTQLNDAKVAVERAGHQGSGHRQRWAGRTPTKAPTCTSRSGASGGIALDPTDWLKRRR